MLVFLVMMALSSGCAALQDRAVSFVKDQGLKVLAKQMEKLELKFEAELKEKGLDIAALKEAGSRLTYALSGANEDPGAAIIALKRGIDAAKDSNGNTQGVGIMALIAYLLKQMWSNKKHDERHRETLTLAKNGSGTGGGGAGV